MSLRSSLIMSARLQKRWHGCNYSATKTMPYLWLLCSYTWHCGIVASHVRSCRCRTLSIHCLTIIWLLRIYVSICKPCIRLTYPIATNTVDAFALVCFFNQIQDAITSHWFYCYGNCAILVTCGLWLQSPWFETKFLRWGGLSRLPHLWYYFALCIP